MLRYGIALIVATVIILGGVVFVRMTFGEIEAKVRQQLKRQKAEGTLPDHWKNVDLDTLKWSDFANQFQMTLPQGLMMRLDMAMLLAGTWYVLVPLTVLLCLAAAYIWGRMFRAS